MSALQPVSAPYAIPFEWKSIVTIASNVVPNNAAADHFQVDNAYWFVLYSFLGATNYDNVAGDFIALIGDPLAAARTLVSPPTVPNNFEVQVKVNNDFLLSNVPIPQGCLCSSGYRAGNQLPFPLLFHPMTNFDFDFYNTAPTLLQLSKAGTALSLQINFGLSGYLIPQDNLPDFLAAFPAYQCFARQNGANWLRNFTSGDLPVS